MGCWPRGLSLGACCIPHQHPPTPTGRRHQADLSLTGKERRLVPRLCPVVVWPQTSVSGSRL